MKRFMIFSVAAVVAGCSPGQVRSLPTASTAGGDGDTGTTTGFVPMDDQTGTTTDHGGTTGAPTDQTDTMDDGATTDEAPGGTGDEGAETGGGSDEGGDTGEENTGGTTGPPPVVKDSDEDGVPDEDDNCDFEANPEQDDLDFDLIGDVCDPDIDGDGVVNASDCEPLNALVAPTHEERCNGFDDNCDGVLDAADSAGCIKLYIDMDGDGAGVSDTEVCLCEIADPETQTVYGGDCNDDDPAISPLALEICNDLDENCNLLIDDGCDDDGDGWCDSNLAMVGTPAICPNGHGDCFDWSDTVNPLAIEIEKDGIDNDCDGIKAGEATGKLEPDCGGFTCLGTSMEAVQCGLDLCYPNYEDMVQSVAVSSPSNSNYSNAYAAVEHFGYPTNDLAPFAPPSYVLLASGTATGTSHSVNLGGSEINDPFDPGGNGANDVVEIKLTMKAPPGAKGFSIDYIFFSEEYEEYIGTSFNDKFYILLNAPETTGGQDTIINFTGCSNPSLYFDFDKDGSKWCYIAINTAFSEPCTNPTTDISGTGFECGAPDSSHGSSTGWLVTTWPIESEEEFTLTFHVHDASDSIYDSEVILDNFTWEADVVVGGTASHN